MDDQQVVQVVVNTILAVTYSLHGQCMVRQSPQPIAATVAETTSPTGCSSAACYAALTQEAAFSVTPCLSVCPCLQLTRQ